MGKLTPAGKLVKDTVRRYPGQPTMTLSKHLLQTHGAMFDGSLDKIRSKIRYYRGQAGEHNRGKAADKSLFQEAVPMPKTWRNIRTPYKLNPGLWLVLADVHVPFHEPMPLKAAVEYGQLEKVDGIFLNGDIMDCAAVSYWPTASRDFNAETDMMVDFLDWLRQSFPDKPIVYKPGNHEFRLPRYFVSKAPELADTLVAADVFERVLGLEERNITFLDYHQIVKAGMLPIIHGHEARITSHGVNPARSLFLKFKSFGMCAHNHRTSEHTETNVNRDYLTTWSMGCLCDLSPEYNPLANNWNWGFATINVEKDGNFEVNNKRVLPDGQVA